MNSERFVFLDGLRGIAAAAVLGMHASVVFGLSATLPNAGLAVDFFFCLSGFVIASAYDSKIVSKLTLPAFAWRRLVRLYPMILIGSVLGTLAAISTHTPRSIVVMGIAAVFIAPLPGALAYPLNLPIWSLFFEGAANAAYGIERRRLPAWALASVAAVAGFSLVGLVALSHHLTGFGVGGKAFVAGAPRVAYPFILGVLIVRTGTWRRMVSLSPWVIALGLSMVLLAPTSSWVFQATMVGAGLPVVVMLGASARKDQFSAAWSLLGRLSYPLYLVHMPVLEITRLTMVGYSPALVAVVGCFSAAAVAYACLVLFDEPVRRWLASLSISRPSAAGA